jgi:DNA-binding beta-propeller fold protein YncE
MSGAWLLRGGRRRRTLALLLLLSPLTALGYPHTARAASVHIPRGSLTQLPGTHGCVSVVSNDGCQVVRDLAGAFGVAVSGDGRNVYVAAINSSAVLTFARDSRTGALSQLAGTGGCTSESGNDGCATGEGLTDAASIAVSPDGHSVYVASLQGVAVFARNPQTGALTQLSGKSGCITENGADGCTPGQGLSVAASVAVSPDGHNVYVASGVPGDAVAIFARDSGTGALRQLSGAEGCWSQLAGDGCRAAHALIGASSVTVAPDGKTVYVAAAYSNAIASFERDPATGALTQGPGIGCTSEGGFEGCATGRGITAANTVAVSPDGRYVYSAASQSSAVAALLRSPGGALDQLGGAYGCTAQSGHDGCATGRGLLSAYSVTLSADGNSLYVASANSLAIFVRDPVSGRILEPRGSVGCIDERGREGCAPGRGLAGASSVAVSPDGNSVYVASYQTGAVAVFARATSSDALSAKLSGVPRRCVKRSFVVHAGAKSTLRLRSLRITLDRHVLGHTKRATLKRRVNVSRLRKGRHHLIVTATDIAGHVATRKATFKRCA